MHYRTFGRTDLSISEICFNVSELLLKANAHSSKTLVVNLLHQAQAAGINTFTVDNTHNDSIAEEILVESFRQKRHQINLFLSCSANDPPSQLNWRQLRTPSAVIRANCEQSLTVLRTDYLDNLWVLYLPTQWNELEEILSALDLLKTEGKIRSGGLSLDINNEQPYDETISAVLTNVDSLAMSYNIIDQQSAEGVFQDCLNQPVGFIAANPHANNLLMDITDENLQGGSPLAQTRLQDLQFMRDHHPLTWDDLAITFCLAQPSVSGVLPYISDSDQLIRYVEACEKEPPCEQCLSSMKSNEIQA